MITTQATILGRQFIVQSTRIGNRCALQKQNVIFLRELRGERMVFRESIPKYRVKMGRLPPLTKLLTDEQVETSQTRADGAPNNYSQLVMDKLEVYKQYLPTDQKPILLEALLNPANTIDQVLRVIDQNLGAMTSFYLGVSFEILDDMMRHGRCDPMTIAVSPELARLCKRTIFRLRYFESDDLLKLIKCLSSLKLPEDTLITRAALQMTRHYINDFNLDELRVLSGCLEKMKPIDETNKSLLIAIQRAIPLAQHIQIESKLFTAPQDSFESLERTDQADLHKSYEKDQ